ncbi:glycosyltransferase [Photobacterium damselae]|uniref:glycosyltransferase n=1 Tax=Photobacterium damselae TaxID=38293 RepID=UPI0010FF1A71|nr:glycosyltransferase [Photobacterium damselae]TLS77479.1 glycosyltransferase [Photobacterium damselae subsp. damselae]TLS89802.1 glycosyltransferase [Photobacterium damselae subsp. damselae]
MNKVAVALSIYKSDTIECLQEAINSILKQTYRNFDLYIEVDGKVDNNILNYLEILECNENVFIDYHSENKGLAFRLNQIIDTVVNKGGYKFIARMDADDISHVNRFEEQVSFLLENDFIDVIGSDIIEIDEYGNEVFYKKMEKDFDKIKHNIIKKCPFNHPSVMFKIEIFNEGFRYDPKLINTQDYYLWIDLLSSGKVFSNINKPLLKFRVNESFHSRRGIKKAINDVKSRLYAFEKLGVINLGNILHVVNLFILRVSPPKIKKIAYKYLR